MTAPTYEGRPLPRPGEEVVDQGLAFDLQTHTTRRRVLAGLGVGAGLAAASVALRSSPALAQCGTAIPEETAGPYPGDGSNGPDVLGQSGVVRRDLTTSFGDLEGSVDGVPLELELYVEDIDSGCVPFAGAAVYAWHCDALGRYSLYSDGVTDQNWLRGVQEADADGIVRFTTIVPGCYSGRWPHIHFEVFPSLAEAGAVANAIATSQVALPEDMCREVYATDGYEGSTANLDRITLESDNVFGEDGGVMQLATVTGTVAEGYTAILDVPVDRAASGGGDTPGEGPGEPPEGGQPPGGTAGGVRRIAGDGRAATAAAVSAATFPAAGVAVAVVASGADFADALCGGPAAATLGGPVLLTDRTSLPEATVTELQRLAPTTILLVGGTGAVSTAVEQQLRGLAPTVERLAGADRYATATAISQRAFTDPVDTVVVAAGTQFPDALAGGPLAAALGVPVLTVAPDHLPDVVAAELDRLAPTTILVMGGAATIGEAVMTALAAHAGTVTRIAGTTRVDTAVAASRQAFPDSAAVVHVVTAGSFPDGLAAVPAAGRTGGPVLLVGSRLTSALSAELTRLAPREVVILGGTAAVSAAVEDAIADLLA